MNREIKFRAWLKKEKKMVEVHKIDFQDRVITHYLDDLPFPTLIKCSFDDVELMQYAGIKDRNGKEIYEGDILVHKFKSYFTEEDRESYYVVKYEDGTFWVAYKDYDNGQFEWINDERLCNSLIEVDKLEVIGNIYENPELLEVE